MRPITVSVTGVGDSNPVVIDQRIAPTNIGLAVIVTGTITYTVQYTFDDVFADGYTASSGNWFNHPTLTGSSSLNSNIAYPVTAVRLTTSAGNDTAAMTVIQAGGGVS